MSNPSISKPLTILYFSRGHTVHDQRFLVALSQTGHRVYFLRLENKQTNGSFDLPANIKPVSWNTAQHSPDHPRSAFGQQQTAKIADLNRIIDDVKPDLIQAGPLHLSAYLAACTGFQPLISMSWGYDLLYDAPRSAETRQAIRYTLQHSAAMVGDCQTIRQLAVSYGMADELIVTFPWGIDLELFSPAIFQSSTDLFTLLSTRGWETIYGTDVIAQAFVIAAHELPELRLVMLGGGSLSGLVRQILGDGDVLDRVSFPGSVGQAELPGYYQAANLYISASHSDGTSISLLEALACGKPVIVSDIPGNCEWVTPGENGWLFPDGNAEALAQAIIAAAQLRRSEPGREELAEMGHTARRLADQRADWTKNFPNLFRAYEIALGLPHPTH